MKRLRLDLVVWLLLALPIAACSSQPAAEDQSVAVQKAEGLPALTRRVVDNANLVSPAAEAQLTRRLAALETRTTNRLVVATVPSLRGETIEGFGARLGRGWGVGQTGENNGVLLIVASTERKVRIEVGYGLKQRLTDPIAGRIIQTRILPRFRQDRMEQGIVDGVDGILAVLDAGSSAERRMAA